MLIAFCGVDGSGKTTQINLLQNKLKIQGKKVYVTKQPTDWYRKDKRVRNFLEGRVSNNELIKELALFSATDRLRQYNNEILPKEKEGYVVIIDRYVYSAYTYFCSRGLEIEWLKEINRYITLPDVTIYIDTPAEIAYQRIIERDGQSAKKEEKDMEFLMKVTQMFKNQIWGKKDNYFIVDGNKSKEQISEEVIQIVKKIIGE